MPNLPEIQVSELEVPPTTMPASMLERTAIGIIARIPGMRGLSPSGRTVTALRGSAWTGVGFGATQVLRMASTVTLARMLLPQTFGLVALVNVFLSGLEMLSDLGIGMDVIQHPRGDEPVFINTAFIIQAGRGVIIWIIAAALAYPFAKLYDQPAVFALAIAASISVLLRGLASGSVWGLTRHVRLRELTFLTSGTELFGFVVSLAWAFVSPTAWALVAGRVASTLAFTVVSHMIADVPVSRAWDPKAAKAIFLFGAGIFLSTSTYFLGGEAERLVVGKFVNLIELGCFSLALSISAAASKGLQQVIAQVFFPMMSSSLRENRDAAVRHYKKARYMLLLTSLGLSVAFVVGSRFVVSVLLGPKYAQAGWMLQLLGVRGALELFTSVTASMLFALGVSRYAAIGNGVKLAFLAAGLTIAFGWYGFHQAMWVLMLGVIANYIPLLFGLWRRYNSVMRMELACFAALVFGTVIAMFVVPVR